MVILNHLARLLFTWVRMNTRNKRIRSVELILCVDLGRKQFCGCFASGFFYFLFVLLLYLLRNSRLNYFFECEGLVSIQSISANKVSELSFKVIKSQCQLKRTSVLGQLYFKVQLCLSLIWLILIIIRPIVAMNILLALHYWFY